MTDPRKAPPLRLIRNSVQQTDMDSGEKLPLRIELPVFIYRCLGIASVILLVGAAVGFLAQKTNDDYSISPQDMAAYLQELGVDQETFQRNLGELGEFIFDGVVANTYEDTWVFHTEGKLNIHKIDFQENLPLPKRVCPLAVGVSYKNKLLHYRVGEATREDMNESEVEHCVVYYVAMLTKHSTKLLAKRENQNSYPSQ